MPRIRVEIEIPDYEYESWSDYPEGMENLISNLKKDMRIMLKKEHIRSFEIDVYHEELPEKH